jgi:hypothetical protein
MAYFSDPPDSMGSHMNNEVRPSNEKFRSVYESGFRIWAHLHSLAGNNLKLPTSYLSVQEAFPQHPSFPATALVECDQWEAFITASSIWGSSSKVPACNHDLPQFKRPVEIGLTVEDPIPLMLSEMTQEN